MDLEQLKARARSGQTFDYLLFWGHSSNDGGRLTQGCLSQWFPSPFTVAGIHYATAEHWMMAEKARLFGDAELLERILTAELPADAKRLGGQVRNFDEQIWRQHRFDIVVRGNHEKFTQQPALRAFLLETGDKVLVEASPLDRIWGIGLAREDARALDPTTWRGLNLLGFALMTVREALRSGI